VVLEPLDHLLTEADRWRLESRLLLEVVLMPMPGMMREVKPLSLEQWAAIDRWLEATRP
jgi:hypothetical protein